MHHSKKVIVRGCPNNLGKYYLRYLAKMKKEVTQEKKKCGKEFNGYRPGKYQGMGKKKKNSVNFVPI